MHGHNASPDRLVPYPPEGLDPIQWEQLNRLLADAVRMMQLAGDTSDGGHRAFRAGLAIFRSYATTIASTCELAHLDRMADRAAREARL